MELQNWHFTMNYEELQRQITLSMELYLMNKKQK